MAVSVDNMDVDKPTPPADQSYSNGSSSSNEVTFVNTLEEPLRAFAQKALSTPNQTTAVSRMDDLEIQLRSHLLKLTQSLLKDPQNTTKSEQVQNYWKSCLELCLHFVHHASSGANVTTPADNDASPYQGLGGAVIRKLPFLLLEDVMETITLEMGKKFWDTTVEPSIEKLCGGDLFVKTSHLVWIRVCNKLVKKQCGGEWAGRILLSVASVFPLSERSGMNVLGSFHVDNVTTYETLEEFQAHEAQEILKTQNKNAAAASSAMMQSSMKMAKTEKEYVFYQTFWGIQKDFSDPNQVNFPDFIERMQTILAVLESHALTTPRREEKARGGNHTTANNNNDTTAIAVGHQKYLTNSQLLHLQLKDPELRIHFLTQFLIVETYLSGKEGSSRFVQHKMADLVKRAKELLKHTPPHGVAHLKTVEWILTERDPMWRQWKKNKCQPDMEKKAAVAVVVEPPSVGGPTKKRRLLDGPLGSSRVAKKDSLYDFKIDVKKDLPAISKRMAETVPDVYEFLEPYVDALDPEAGIEEEYHPKNDKLFSWRGLRLLGRRHLNDFAKVQRRDGDFERLVRHVYKEERDTDIPGDMPKEEPLETQDDINQRIKEEEEEAARVKAEEEEAARIKAEEEEAARVKAEEEESAARIKQEEEKALAAAKVEDDEKDDDNDNKDDARTKEEGADKSPIPEAQGSFDDASVGTPMGSDGGGPKDGQGNVNGKASTGKDSMDVEEEENAKSNDAGGTKRKRDDDHTPSSNGTQHHAESKAARTADANKNENGNSRKGTSNTKQPEKEVETASTSKSNNHAGDNNINTNKNRRGTGGGGKGHHEKEESSSRPPIDKRSPPTGGRGSPGRGRHTTDSFSSRNRSNTNPSYNHKGGGGGGKGGSYSGSSGNKFEPNHNRRNPNPPQDRRRSPDRGGGGRGPDNRRNNDSGPQRGDGRGGDNRDRNDGGGRGGDHRDRNDGSGGGRGGGYRGGGGGRYDSNRQDSRSGGGGGRRRQHGGGGGRRNY